MRYCAVVLLVAIQGYAFAQGQGYKIDFKIKGLQDTTVVLAYYYGEATYPKDTAKVNSQGVFSFEGKETLDPGFYFMVIGKARQFDFLVGKNQRFGLAADRKDYYGTMVVTNDEDNKLFFDNVRYNQSRHKEAEPFLAQMKDSTLTEDQRKQAREKYNKISEEVLAYQDKLIAQHPEMLTARMLKATKAITVPDPPKKADGSIDSTFQWRYYRKHYFDNFDLADDALIHMPRPVYSQKLDEYLDRLIIQTADSVMAAVDDLAARAKKNQETYKYLVWSCAYKYQRPAVMGLDEVFVRIYDKYYATGLMDFWITPALKKTLKDHAEKLRYSTVGKTAQNMIMQDQNLQPKSLYDIKSKYTIIYFFDPDCGHCKEESPKLVKFYNSFKTKFGLEVFAVSADTSIQKMRDYIKEMKMTWITVNGPRSYLGAYSKSYHAETTPTLYVIDEKKKIIAKGLSTERLEEFLNAHERIKARLKKGT